MSYKPAPKYIPEPGDPEKLFQTSPDKLSTPQRAYLYSVDRPRAYRHIMWGLSKIAKANKKLSQAAQTSPAPFGSGLVQPPSLVSGVTKLKSKMLKALECKLDAAPALAVAKCLEILSAIEKQDAAIAKEWANLNYTPLVVSVDPPKIDQPSNPEPRESIAQDSTKQQQIAIDATSQQDKSSLVTSLELTNQVVGAPTNVPTTISHQHMIDQPGTEAPIIFLDDFTVPEPESN